MKIFQINTVCGTGSTGRIAVDIAQVLQKEGHTSCIAYGRGNAPSDVDSFKIDSKEEVYLHAALSRFTDAQGLYSTSATKRLIQKIRDYDPDIIHLHNIHGYFLNYKVLFQFLSRYNKPIVWTLHDCWAFTGHCAYFDYVHCDFWKTECHDCPQKDTYPTSWLMDRSRENFRLKKSLFTGIKNLTIVTPSHWLAGLVKQSFLKEYPVEVIHNGIDLNVFKPTPSDFRKKYHIEDKKIILGVASPWTPRKGLKDFIKLAELVDEETRIVLVGLNDKQSKRLPENIIGIKRTNNPKELAGIYTAADVFFNPTYEDNYPTTNLEALACGTPVVTYNTGGSPESAGSTAVIIEQKDFTQMLNVLDLDFCRISLNKSQMEHLSKERCALTYLNIYSEAQI